MKGVVTKDFDEMNNGEVKVDGKLWSAVSTDRLKVGDMVEILEINSVKLIVKRYEEE